MWIILLLVFLLVFISVQDIVSRSVYWLLFPLLFGISVFAAWGFLWLDCCLNILFVLFMLIALTIYVSIKEKRMINITKGYFCWGDILFLLSVTPLLSLHSYVFYFTAGTFLTLMIHLTVNLFRSQKNVPYAGYMALVMALLLVFSNAFNEYMVIFV